MEYRVLGLACVMLVSTICTTLRQFVQDKKCFVYYITAKLHRLCGI